MKNMAANKIALILLLCFFTVFNKLNKLKNKAQNNFQNKIKLFKLKANISKNSAEKDKNTHKIRENTSNKINPNRKPSKKYEIVHHIIKHENKDSKFDQKAHRSLNKASKTEFENVKVNKTNEKSREVKEQINNQSLEIKINEINNENNQKDEILRKMATNLIKNKENPYKNLEIFKDPNINPQDLPFNKKGTNTNFLALKVNGETEIKSPPYKITRCDQSVHFNTDYIPDLEDYLVREEGAIVINAHYLHLFTKDKKELLESILLSQSQVAPSEPRGAKGCIQIDGGLLSKNILLCPKTDDLRKNIYNILSSFSDCRSTAAGSNEELGDNTNANVVIKEVKNCSLVKKGENPKDIINKFNKEKKEREARNLLGEDTTWSPEPLKVPGAEEEEIKK